MNVARLRDLPRAAGRAAQPSTPTAAWSTSRRDRVRGRPWRESMRCSGSPTSTACTRRRAACSARCPRCTARIRSCSCWRAGVRSGAGLRVAAVAYHLPHGVQRGLPRSPLGARCAPRHPVCARGVGGDAPPRAGGLCAGAPVVKRLAWVLATWFGCWAAPIAPGTMGTLGRCRSTSPFGGHGPVAVLAAAAVVT